MRTKRFLSICAGAFVALSSLIGLGKDAEARQGEAIAKVTKDSPIYLQMTNVSAEQNSIFQAAHYSHRSHSSHSSHQSHHSHYSYNPI